MVRRRAALNKTVWVLNTRVFAPLGRHVVRFHATALQNPALASIPGNPYTANRDAKSHVIRVFGMDTDRVNRRVVGPTAHPLQSLGSIPERTLQLPRLTEIF